MKGCSCSRHLLKPLTPWVGPVCELFPIRQPYWQHVPSLKNHGHLSQSEFFTADMMSSENTLDFIQTNHVPWMSKVGIAVAKAHSPIGQSHQVYKLIGRNS